MLNVRTIAKNKNITMKRNDDHYWSLWMLLTYTQTYKYTQTEHSKKIAVGITNAVLTSFMNTI